MGGRLPTQSYMENLLRAYRQGYVQAKGEDAPPVSYEGGHFIIDGEVVHLNSMKAKITRLWEKVYAKRDKVGWL